MNITLIKRKTVREIARKCLVGLVSVSAIAAMPGCGGGGPGPTPDPTPSPTQTATGGGGGTGSATQAQIDAALSTAKNLWACQNLAPFYFEIGGNQGSPFVTGTGGKATNGSPTTAPDRVKTLIKVGTASQLVYSAYALEKLSKKGTVTPVAADRLALLDMTAGYDNMVDSICATSADVNACLAASNGSSSAVLPNQPNGTMTAYANKFFYNSGNFETLQSFIGNGAAPATPALTPAAITTDLRVVGLAAGITVDDLTYVTADVATGLQTNVADYADFLQKGFLKANAKLYISKIVKSSLQCTNPTDTNCLTTVSTPIPYYGVGAQAAAPNTNDSNGSLWNESWSYNVGAFIEDDSQASAQDPAPATGAVVGDGAISSPGNYGFYAWVDSAQTTYGILALEDHSQDNLSSVSADHSTMFKSVICGRSIRAAFAQGQEITSPVVPKNMATYFSPVGSTSCSDGSLPTCSTVPLVCSGGIAPVCTGGAAPTCTGGVAPVCSGGVPPSCASGGTYCSGGVPAVCTSGGTYCSGGVAPVCSSGTVVCSSGSPTSAGTCTSGGVTCSSGVAPTCYTAGVTCSGGVAPTCYTAPVVCSSGVAPVCTGGVPPTCTTGTLTCNGGVAPVCNGGAAVCDGSAAPICANGTAPLVNKY